MLHYASKELIAKYPKLKLDRIAFHREIKIEWLLGHELGHMIYFWLTNKKERIIQPLMGYPQSIAITPMTFADALVEGKVFIIHNKLVAQGIVEDPDKLLSPTRIGGFLDYAISLASMGTKLEYYVNGKEVIRRIPDSDFRPELSRFYNEIENYNFNEIWTEFSDWVLSQTAHCS